MATRTYELVLLADKAYPLWEAREYLGIQAMIQHCGRRTTREEIGTMTTIERPSYYDAPDDDCPRCGWGPIGCNEEETGCVAVRAVYESEFDTRPMMVAVDLNDLTDPDERPFD